MRRGHRNVGHHRGQRGPLGWGDDGVRTAAQVIRLSIPWLFGLAVNALQTTGIAGVREGGMYLLGMLVAAIVAWALHGSSGRAEWIPPPTQWVRRRRGSR